MPRCDSRSAFLCCNPGDARCYRACLFVHRKAYEHFSDWRSGQTHPMESAVMLSLSVKGTMQGTMEGTMHQQWSEIVIRKQAERRCKNTCAAFRVLCVLRVSRVVPRGVLYYIIKLYSLIALTTHSPHHHFPSHPRMKHDARRP